MLTATVTPPTPLPYPVLKCIPSSFTSDRFSSRPTARSPPWACCWRWCLAQRTARIASVDPARLWNLCILSLFAALAAARLLLVVSQLERAATASRVAARPGHGASSAAGRRRRAGGRRLRRLVRAPRQTAASAPRPMRWPRRSLSAWPLSSWARLLAGSGYGTRSRPRRALGGHLHQPLAAIWSGTPARRSSASGAGLCGAGVSCAGRPALRLAAPRAPHRRRGRPVPDGPGLAIYLTEMWRDPEGRGSLLHGALDGPQIAAVLLVLAGR